MDDLYKAKRQAKNQGQLNVTFCVMVIVMMLISACSSNNKTYIASKPEQTDSVTREIALASSRITDAQPQSIFDELANKSGFITGENICIDGGMTKQMIYHAEHGWTLNE